MQQAQDLTANAAASLIFEPRPGFKSTRALSYNCALGLPGMRPDVVRRGLKNSSALTLYLFQNNHHPMEETCL